MKKEKMIWVTWFTILAMASFIGFAVVSMDVNEPTLKVIKMQIFCGVMFIASFNMVKDFIY